MGLRLMAISAARGTRAAPARDEGARTAAPAAAAQPDVEHEPTVAAAPAGGWQAWLHALLTRAKGRLAGVSLLLAGALALDAAARWLFGDRATEVRGGAP